MKIKSFFFWSFFLIGTLSLAQKTEILFDVFLKDKKIGMLRANETKAGVKSFKELKTETDTKVLLLTFHIESDVAITKENGTLTLGTAYRDSNRGAYDVQTQVKKIGFKLYERKRNEVKDTIANQSITFCVADLYFEEPIGVKNVFSITHAQLLNLRNVGPGKYQLITPDNIDSFYIYKRGKLTSIEVNTIAGKVVSIRISKY